ncbi:hypothetical protein FRC08_005876 [Ceratobasidium sp. 394]|nr:hypothetical protein FRC08_005876 [Ceratobasidium sp. 394]
MSSRKVPDVDANSLAASRTRRSNAGVPRRPFESVTEQLERRAKRAENATKASVAAAIEADPFTGDDSLARQSPPEFFPPTLTGNNEVDKANYDESRAKHLIHFIAFRDAIDVRSAFHLGEIGLAELEEIYADPEAAVDLLSRDADAPKMSTTKGKGKDMDPPRIEGLHAAKVQQPRAETNYGGITIDAKDQIVKAKHAPKDTPPNTESVKCGTKRPLDQGNHNSHTNRAPINAQPANYGRAGTPLRPTDSQTLIDGNRLACPNYWSLRSAPRSAAGTPTNSGTTGHGKAPHNPQTVPKLQDSRAQVDSTRQKADHPPRAAPNNPGANSNSAPTRTTLPPNRPQPASHQNAPAHAAPRNGDGPATLHGPRALPPPRAQGTVNRANGSAPRTASNGHNGMQGGPAQGNRRPALPVEGNNNEEDALGGEEANPPEANPRKKKVAGKVTVASFPEVEQPVILEMARVARARIIANGAYDDAAAEIA